jgi:LysR family transcriptional regulator, regulator for bpeEF and oprC
MELYELAVFVKVIQTGSFTKAADLLNTHKAQLSRVVSQLEGNLGVRLIERTTRSLSLTEVGRELFERAIGILASVEDAERMAQQTLGEPRGLLKMTCGVEFGMMLVSDWVVNYLQRFPQVSVEADWNNRIVDLVHEGFDLAIRLGELSDSSLAARKLGQVNYGLYAAPSYLARQGMPQTIEDFSQHDLLMFIGGAMRQGWLLEQNGQKHRVSNHQARIRINNSYAAKDATVAGLGIARLPRMLAQPHLDSKQLVQVVGAWQVPSVPVYAVFPSSRYLTPKVREFVDLAVAAMKLLP